MSITPHFADPWSFASAGVRSLRWTPLVSKEVSTLSKQYRGTREYALIFAELITAARYRGTVTYQELAELVGLPTHGTHMGAELGGYLGAISEDEVKQGRPMLSAIAIGTTGKPGGGFYPYAKELGRLTSDDPAAQLLFWEAEKRAVYATWQRSFAKA